MKYVKNAINHFNKASYAILKKSFKANTIIIYMLLLISSISYETLQAQRTVIIEPDNFPAEVGQMNTVIEGDTTSTGERVDENTIYILKKDGVYWLDGTIVNSDYHLRIEAEDGEGHPPIIRPAVDLTGSSSKVFQPRDDFTLKGIYISHITDQGGLEKNPIRASGENSRIVIDNCWFDYDEQSFVRIDNSNISLHITNSIGRNIGRNDGSGNGRIFDTRGIETDSIIVENNTFYNLQQNPIRTGGGITKFMKINHNTIVDARSNFEFGSVFELVFTNNLFTNVGFRGVSPENLNPGLFSFVSINDVEGISDSDRSLLISNNNFERPIDELSNPDFGVQVGPFVTAIQSIINDSPDRINIPVFDSTATQLISDGILLLENNIVESEEDISYVNRPDIQNIIDFHEHDVFSPDDIENFPLMWDNPESRIEGSSLDDWRNFAYSTASQSFTAAQNGFPVGDLNWFPEKKQEWEGVVTSNENVDTVVRDFKLEQNYPNPFNPSTNIVFEIPNSSAVTLEVYDILGRKVQTLLKNESFSTGTHNVTFDASALSSGIYIARLQTESGILRTIRMSLIK